MSKEIKKLEEEYEEKRVQLNELKKKINLLKTKELLVDNFQNRYIKYNQDGIMNYMLVDNVYCDGRTSADIERTFNGFGFCYEFANGSDSIWSSWDYMAEFTIWGDEKHFRQEIGKIKFITKDEFNKAFHNMMENVLAYHEKHKSNREIENE